MQPTKCINFYATDPGKTFCNLVDLLLGANESGSGEDGHDLQISNFLQA